MPDGNGGKLPVRALIEDVMRARGGDKLRVILDAPDPGALVRALPPEDLYFTIQAIGEADSAELVQLASPEQFRALVDLDAWERDEPRLDRVMLWLRLARDPDDEESFRAKIASLDVELFELLLKKAVVLHDLAENPDPEVSSTFFMRTPDGKWLVEFPGEAVEAHAARRLLDDLYAEDPFRASRLLEAVRWELPSELTETALRWRTGRLRDMGFPSLEEAMELFAPPRAVAVPPPPPPSPSASFPVAAARGELLDRAAALLSEDPAERFLAGLVYVANSMMVAEAVQPSNLDAVGRMLAYARGAVNLGLFQLSGGEVERAAALLAETSAKQLFQTGFASVAALGRRAARVAPRLTLPGASAPALDAPEGLVLQGLTRRRPRLYDPRAGSDVAEPAPEAAGGGWRGFSTPEDLATARAALDFAEGAADVLEAAGWDRLLVARAAEESGRAPGEVSASGAWASYAARALLGEVPAWKPLSAHDLRALAARAFENGALRAEAARALVAPLLEAGERLRRTEAARKLADRALLALDQAVGAPLRAKAEPDPRFSGALLACAE